jgi:hypothetical protein
MKQMYKRWLCLMLLIAMVFASIPKVFAESSNCSATETLDEIMDDYYHQLSEVRNDGATDSTRAAGVQVHDVISSTMSRLSASGYNAYSVEPDTFTNVEKELNTDFEEIGMDPNCSYIVVLGVDGDQSSSLTARQTVGSSFTFTYMGYIHTMRYITVFPADDSRYIQSKPYNCLSSETDEGIIKSFLNTGITALLNALNQTLSMGTIAGMFGIDFSVLEMPQPISVTLYGGVRWVRVYTQIYNQAMAKWETWGSVDRMKVTGKLVLHRYESSIDDYVVEEIGAWSSAEIYSSHYHDTTYRNQQAALGLMNRYGRHEYVGGAYMYYGTTLALIFYQYQAVSPP